MRRTLSFAVLIPLLLAGNSWARIWYVKPDSTGAVINIQAGIDSCAAGDTVVAMPGVYRGAGNWDLDFWGKPIVVMSASRYDSTITDSTLIDGEHGHRGFYFHSGETHGSVLEGFVITNGGICQDCYDNFGGGIVCDLSSSPIIRYNKIRNCYVPLGGGIYCSRFSAPIISNNEFSRCGARDGTAIYCSGSSAPVISNNKIHHCPGEIYGEVGVRGYGSDFSIPIVYKDRKHMYDMTYYWAISCYSSSPLIINNTINDLGYYPQYGGVGAICCSSCPSCAVIGNKIYGNYGGIAIWGISISSCSATIKGNEITRNQGTDYGIEAFYSTAIIVSNSIHENIYGGSAVDCGYSSATIDSNYIHGNGLPYDTMDPTYGIAIWDSKAILRYNEISSNTTGGISYQGDSSGTIENNRIADNGHWYGYGGIQCWSPVDIIGNTIINNESHHPGGGIACYSSASIKNNVIISNFCWSHQGGGIFCDGPSPSIMSNTIVGNVAGRGSGICIGAASHAVVSCNIISDNRLHDESEGLYHDGGGIYSESDSVTISCCDVYDNQGGNYVGLPDQTGINGNFSAGPIFCDAGSGDYKLHISSPCLPGNHPDGASCGLIGALGQGCNYVATLVQEYHAEIDAPAIVVTWRLAKIGEHMDFSVLRAEMPSEEYQEIPEAHISREGLSFTFRDMDCKPGAIYRYRVDVSDEAGRRSLFETDRISLPALPLTLYQNYPNPFNPSTTIRYYLPGKARVSIEIYDISGRRLSQLVRKEEETGFHVAEWDGTDDRGSSVASGVYFYRLTTGKETISRKMVLLK